MTHKYRASFGRDERHLSRVRHIYGVFFAGTDVYVGQSVDLRRRESEHRKAWRYRFRFIKLDSLRGTFADAENAEQAWRCLAQQKGHTILAHQGNRAVHVNPDRRRTAPVQALMSKRRWPKHLRVHGGWQGKVGAATIVGGVLWWAYEMGWDWLGHLL
jgi:hypothetical protein